MSQLITPNSQPVPMGLSIMGLELPGGKVGPQTLEDLYRLVAFHALLANGGVLLATDPQRLHAALSVAVQTALRSRIPASAAPSPATPDGAASVVQRG
jgi:hypothetical protein